MPRSQLALSLFALTAALAGCPAGDDDDTIEPLELPDDPAASGAPVGVRTVEAAGVTMEVWYPAPDAFAGEPGDTVQLATFVPDVVLDALGPIELPPLATVAVRDAPLRDAGEPYPAVLFSHGFGGMRVQSVDVTAHLASRGYVVVGVDHPGRMLGDVLPCVFTEPLEGCDLAGMLGDDPAPAQLQAALGWLEGEAAGDGWLGGAVDLERIGLTGHSAGGVSTSTLGHDDDRFDALLPMAGAVGVARDVPTLLLGGTCDLTFELERLDEAHGDTTDGTLVTIAGAGHLAFTDLCELDLGALGEQYLVPNPDVNPLMLDPLMALATDGCAGVVPAEPPDPACGSGFLALETSAPIVRHVATAWFDQQLRDGGGLQLDGFAEVEVH